MDVRVGRLLARAGVHKAGIELIDVERAGDPLAQLAQHIPDHALLLHVEIVEGRHVAARRHNYVAGRPGVRRGQSNGVLVDNPGVFEGRAAIRAV